MTPLAPDVAPVIVWPTLNLAEILSRVVTVLFGNIF